MLPIRGGRRLISDLETQVKYNISFVRLAGRTSELSFTCKYQRKLPFADKYTSIPTEDMRLLSTFPHQKLLNIDMQ